jgi:hypothetical protein
MPKPIKPCGKVVKEPVVPTKERKTIAVQMAADGTTSSSEYIKMIDSSVSKGELKNNIATAINLQTAKDIGIQKKRSFEEFMMALKDACKTLSKSESYKSDFESRKMFRDSKIDLADGIRAKLNNTPAPELDDTEKEFFAKFFESNATSVLESNSDAALALELSKAFEKIQAIVFKRFNIDEHQLSRLVENAIIESAQTGDDEVDINVGDNVKDFLPPKDS